MCLLDFLKPKIKKQVAPKESKTEKTSLLGNLGKGKAKPHEAVEPDLPDEEYQLPTLAKGSFTMTEELRRRQQEELLKKKYGISFPKEGSFI